VAIAVPALAATPKVGKWTGTTAFKLPAPEGIRTVPVYTHFSTIRATNGGRRVKRFGLEHFKLVDCVPREAGPYGGHGFVSHAKPKVRNGKFKFTEKTGNTTNYKLLKVRGRFTSRKRAKGTLSFTVAKPGAKCTTGGRMQWTVRLGSGSSLPSPTK
jgi:hypothetical protein